MKTMPEESAFSVNPSAFRSPRGGSPQRRAGLLLSLAVATAWVFGCDDPMPPVACGTIPQQAVTVGFEVQVEPCFEDPEMAVLTLAAVSSNPEVATAEMLGDKVRIAGVSPGTAAITVTATDPDMLEGELTFDVLVPNRGPRLFGPMPAVRFKRGDPAVRLTLPKYFVDPDGQTLTYGATSSDTTVASLTRSADTLAVSGVSEGVATVSVTATDPDGLSTTATTDVRVTMNRPPVVNREVIYWYTPIVEMRETQVGIPLEPSQRPHLFSDPDGDILTYSVMSTDTFIARARVDNTGAKYLRVFTRGAAVGRATVRVTATDSFGQSATFEIVVLSCGHGFRRDDFDSEPSSLQNWALRAEATAAFGDGMVRVMHPNPPNRPYIGLFRRQSTVNWTIKARMGNLTKGSWAQVRVNLWRPRGAYPYTGLALQVGADPEHHWTEEDTNWQLLGWPRGKSGIEVIASGESESVGGVGELVDVTLSHLSDTFTVSIADSVVFRSRTGFGNGWYIHITHVHLTAWPAPGTEGAEKIAVFDWFELDGRWSGYRTGETRVPTATAPMVRHANGPALRGRRRPTTWR